jgi:DNA polymerase-3 subunit beta
MEINLKALLTTLEANAKVLGGNKVIPAYENILFEIVEGACKITTSDGKIRVTTKMFIDKSVTVSFMIYGKTFLDTLRLIDSETVILDVKEKEVIIKAGKSKYKMPKFNPSEYPAVPELENAKTVTISNPVELVAHINKAVSFTNPNDLRLALTAISLSSKEGKIFIQGTDSYILYSGYVENSDEIDEVLLYHTCTNVLDSFKEEKEISLHTTAKMAVMEGSSISVYITLIDGSKEKFPLAMVAKFIKMEGGKIEVNRSQFLKQVKRALLYANNTSKALVFKIENEEFTIQATDIDFNKESKDFVDYTNIDSEGFQVCLNGQKLVNCLNSITDETVILLIKSETDFFHVKSKDNKVCALIAPIALNKV